MKRKTIGKVYLVGAGPGDSELITIKGLKCIKKADILIYDYLANNKLLKNTKSDSEVIYVGKKIGKHTLEQEEINKLLVEKALKGKIVTRLKGGDPLVFGRGAEEAIYLKKNGIPFEIIPGVTSIISVPAYAGIPVTHRGLSVSFAVITGHEDPKKEFPQVKWDRVASGLDTLIIIMGMKNLSYITKILMKNGLSSEKDIAIIQWGCTPRQKTVVGKLKNINELVKKEDLSSPSVIIIGDVVKLRNELNWFESKPLFGKKVMITRPEEQASEIVELLSNIGAEVIEFPLIKIMPPYTWKYIDETIKKLKIYDWIIFTSVNGVKYFFQRFFKYFRDIREFEKVKICAIGETTEKMIKDYYLDVDLIPGKYTSESLVEVFSKMRSLKNKRFLLPRANIANEYLSNELRKFGAIVDEISVYRTLTVREYNNGYVKMLKKGDIDIITFTSSPTVKSFISMAKKNNMLNILSSLEVVSIGPETTKTALENGFNVKAEAKIHNIKGEFNTIMDLYN